MTNVAVRDCLARLAPTRTLIAISGAVAALFLFPLAAFAITYAPGQTLNPACLPTDPTCVVATSTFAGDITVAGTASSTNVVVSNTFTFGTLTGILKAVDGVVSAALVNLATDVTGILPIANGGTATSTQVTNGVNYFDGTEITSGTGFVYSGGNVGIASSSPSATLSVGGNISATAYQINGSNLLTSEGSWLALGTGALASTSPGYGDVAVGTNALADASGDWFNTAVGWYALAHYPNGGNLNVAVGYNAGYELDSGGSVTFVGDHAGYGLASASNVIAIGQGNFYANEGPNFSATNTVAIGSGLALYSSGGIQGGVYVGQNLSQHITTGADYNTFIGYQSGSDITTGADNILIGPEVNTGGTHLKTGSNDILIGYNANTPATTASNLLNIGGILFGTLPATTSATSFSVSTAGMIGIGTSTPYSRLSVWGPDSASSTSAFAVVNSASTTVFSVFDGGNAELSGSLSQSSDERLKTNITSLDASSSLSAIDELNPVTFNWIDPDQTTALQSGFIAQQVQQIFPNLVSTTSATALTPDGTLSLNYIGLISPIVSAIQEISADINSIENTLAGFAESFVSNQITASQELCVGSTCVTPSQFQAMAAAANVSESSGEGSGGPSSADAQATDTPPVIQINGDNPAIIQVGDTYNDLGATIEGPQQDLNLGIQTFVNGAPMSPVQIDTSQAATDTIDYVATDQTGLTSTSTRTVIIKAAAAVNASSTAQ